MVGDNPNLRHGGAGRQKTNTTKNQSTHALLPCSDSQIIAASANKPAGFGISKQSATFGTSLHATRPDPIAWAGDAANARANIGSQSEPIDIVYLWVDGDLPGFREVRDRYATTAFDRDPARYRDNLDLLKFSLRGLCEFVPWVRDIYIVTCRPQRPTWLGTSNPRLRIVYHDEFIDAGALPVYNSNAIISYLDRLPGLSKRFLYCEDDILWTAPTTLSHFTDERGRLRVYQRFGHTPDAERREQNHKLLVNSAWAHNNHLLDSAFGRARRTTHTHAPLLVDTDLWREFVSRWPDEIARTRKNRFRTRSDAIPVYLYRHFLLNTGRAVKISRLKSYQEAHYHGLESFKPWAWFGLNVVRLLKPNTTCLGDNWGETPPPSITAMVRRFLDARFPTPSPFEKNPGVH